MDFIFDGGDTSRDAAEAQWEIFSRMTPEKRLEQALQLSATCRDLLAEGVRQRFPEYDAQRIRLAVIRLILPADLFMAAYPGARDLLP